MSATDNACLKELSALIESGLSPSEAIDAAIKRNRLVGEAASRANAIDLLSVAANRIAWYEERRK